MRTLKLTISYDGTNYVGWQRQVNGLSVQQVIEEACAPLVGGVAPTVAGAGRTDAGVHAAGQVASVNLESDLAVDAIQRALNVRLPADIRVLAVEDARQGFHARFDAAGKSYRYRISVAPVLSPFDRFYVWHAPEPKRLDWMRQAAAALVGRHDFLSFQARGAYVRETVRTLDRLQVTQAGDELILDCAGDGFLRHMVRIIAGTLAEVGTGLRPAGSMAGVLEARDRRVAGATAPAQGLTLMGVRY
ncbi:MAG TPA: tRNA pseudouridine(38-40) synthase TruA [Vicinamibacterales bacterium]|nr:tRNA pseudouridine(38-40) synthase TruA [Vicinamibacterales bacterium]